MIIESSLHQNDPAVLLNRALCYGDGVFETMRFNQNGIPLWEKHMKRLTAGLHLLGIKLPDLAALKHTIAQMLNGRDELSAQAGVIKLIVFRAGLAKGYGSEVDACEWVLSYHETEVAILNNAMPLELAVADTRLSHQPMLAGLKHLNRLEQVIAARELTNKQYHELILCDHEGLVIEAVSSNILLFTDAGMCSPKLGRCGVKGVGLNWCEQHFDIEYKNIELKDIKQSQGLCLINSVKGPRLVKSIEGMISYGQPMAEQDKMNKLWLELFA